eukprot:c20787_g11_i4.p1 GENE.c20787_g11_i4~~c20787_g11_i4.p1  ORF type:complete len:306 (-),score=62.35 c20787_g11_i4:72-989(-)
MSAPSVTGLNSLPGKIRKSIFSRLDPQSLANCMGVCKSWNREIATDGALWEGMIFSRLNTRVVFDPKTPETPLQRFVSAYLGCQPIIPPYPNMAELLPMYMGHLFQNSQTENIATFYRPLNIILLGDSRQGKTTLASMFTQGVTPTNYDATIEDRYPTSVILDDVLKVNFELVDGGGSMHALADLMDGWVRASDVVCLVYDRFSESKAYKLSGWFTDIYYIKQQAKVIVLSVDKDSQYHSAEGRPLAMTQDMLRISTLGRSISLRYRKSWLPVRSSNADIVRAVFCEVVREGVMAEIAKFSRTKR